MNIAQSGNGGPRPALQCSGLHKAFGTVVAVDDVSLTVGPGEILSLLGPSGCGKTTCLRLIAGFDRPDTGTIMIGGRLVCDRTTLVPPEQRHVGMVFQDYALFPHLSVAANVQYGLAPDASTSLRRRLQSRLPGRAESLHPRVATVLELVGLTLLALRYPHELSGGEAQRVALARALAPSPALILFDEPFSNLDARLRVSVRTEVRQILKRAGAAAIFVTHDQEEAFTLADRVAVMWEGRIAQVGTPEEVYRRPATRAVAAFVGDAAFLPGHIRDHGVETELGLLAITQSPPATGARVDVMIRPERLHLHAAPDGLAEVLGREFFGHDQLLLLLLPSGRTLHARLGPDDLFEIGDRVRLTLVGDPILYPHPTD